MSALVACHSQLKPLFHVACSPSPSFLIPSGMVRRSSSSLQQNTCTKKRRTIVRDEDFPDLTNSLIFYTPRVSSHSTQYCRSSLLSHLASPHLIPSRHRTCPFRVHHVPEVLPSSWAAQAPATPRFLATTSRAVLLYVRNGMLPSRHGIGASPARVQMSCSQLLFATSAEAHKLRRAAQNVPLSLLLPSVLPS